jgi:hypothetical protein
LNKTILGALAVAAVCVATLLIGEGINAVARWSKLDGSVTYHTYMLIKGAVARGSKSSEHEGPPFTRLLERDELDALIPKLKAAYAVLGNSRYDELRNELAAINTREGGCLVQKPNVHKTCICAPTSSTRLIR